jgi:hypothetical protein
MTTPSFFDGPSYEPTGQSGSATSQSVRGMGAEKTAPSDFTPETPATT